MLEKAPVSYAAGDLPSSINVGSPTGLDVCRLGLCLDKVQSRSRHTLVMTGVYQEGIVIVVMFFKITGGGDDIIIS